ncbi:MAG TPA: ribosome small subunit-dependent GTPase A [Gammaproteobacteria bacterium]|nr:ribosome small subunit-dependent GTPase A [Gammaproteobacteria bacterium]
MVNPPRGRPGLAITHHGHSVVVEEPTGELCLCSVRRSAGRVVCGDRVHWQAVADGRGVIVGHQPRTSVLTRPDARGRTRALAANVDQMVIVTALEPALQEALVDRYLVAAARMGARALIVLNKWDLADAGAGRGPRQRLAEFSAIGYPVLLTSRHDPLTLEALGDQLRGRTSILVGQSGVGKSSLVGALLPGREIRIGQLSATGLGTHTTSATTLYHLPGGGDLIDSPGVRDFHPAPVSAEELLGGFPELAPWTGECRFHNCRHLNEPGCAVAGAAERGQISLRRLASYRRLRAELEATA